MKKKIATIAALLCALSSCIDIEGPYETALYRSGQESATKAVTFDFGDSMEAGTKSILGSGIESKNSGGVLAVYNAATGTLDSQYTVPDISKTFKVDLPVGKKNIYMLANLWNLDAATSAKLPLEFPKSESEVASMLYRINGATVSEGVKRETFSQVKTYGIPMAGSLKGVDVSKVSTVQIPLVRLFSRLNITIDQSGLDGGANPDFFKNVKLYVRQANCRIKPFAGTSRSSVSADVIKTSDYVSSMTDGTRTTYVFYVPENVHGNLMPGNTDPAEKDMDGVAAAGYSARQPYLTYVEFTGSVSPDAGGYGGTVTYRFFLGADSTSDFSVHRNTDYNITLGFKVNSLFEPDWKLSVGSDWEDRRRFGLSADASGTTLLPQGQMIAVRKNRAGECYLFFNKEGKTGSNQASALKKVSNGFEPADLSSAAWSIEAPDLATYGISANYSGGKLSFKVSTSSKFVAGKDIPVRLHLYPGDLTYDVTVRTYDNIAVSVSSSLKLQEGFYVGMSRKLTVKGLAGTRVYYWDASGKQEQSLKSKASLSAGWIGTSRSETQSVAVSSGLTLYAYAPGTGMKLRLASDDAFNDGASFYDADVVVEKPGFSLKTNELSLPITGDEVSLDYEYLDKNGSAIARSRFNSTVFGHVLQPVVQFSDDAGQWLDSDGESVWVKCLSTLSGHIAHNVSDDYKICDANIFNKDNDKLLPMSICIKVPIPHWTKKPPVNLMTDYYNVAGNSSFSTYGEVMVYGNKWEVLLSGPNADNVTTNHDVIDDHTVGIEWQYSDLDEHVNNGIPYGEHELTILFRNKHSREIYGRAVPISISHVINLGVFMLFQKDSPFVNEISITTAKNAFLRKQYYENGVGSNVTGFPGSNGSYKSMILMKYYKATAIGHSTMTTRYGNYVIYDYSYQDVDNSFYGQYPAWTEQRINSYVSSGRTPFSTLDLTGPAPSYTKLYQPIGSELLEDNIYVHVTLSNRLVGYAVIK